MIIHSTGMKQKRMVPRWLFLTTVIPLILATSLLTYVHFFHNPLAFPDRGNAGFVLPSMEVRQVVVDVLREHGLSPDYRVDTDDVSRAIYHGKIPFILDVTSPEAAQVVGNPDSFIAVVTKNPATSAESASKFMKERGFNSQVVHDPDPGLTAGKLSVVLSEAFPNKMIVFRRHILKMGSAPPAWTDDKIN